MARVVRVVAGGQNAVTDRVAFPDLAGYRVYYGTANGNYPQGPFDTFDPDITTITVGLNSGETYYIVVVAYDTSSNESGFSNVVCKTIP